MTQEGNDYYRGERSTMENLKCHYCEKPVPDDHIDLEGLFARCPACRKIFSFATDNELVTYYKEKKTAGKTVFSPPGRPAAAKPPPRQKTLVKEQEKAITFSTPLSLGSGRAVYLIAAILWYLYTLPNALQALFFKGDFYAIRNILIFVMIGYFPLVKAINSMVVVIKNGRITVRSRPFPWWGNYNIKQEKIFQIYSREDYTRSEGDTPTYSVFAVFKKGSELELAGILDTPEKALAIENQVEKLLGLEDYSIDGELRSRKKKK